MSVRAAMKDEGEIYEEPITDTLDLHHFPAKIAISVTEEYLAEAARRGFPEVRVIHGRGKGIMRQRVLGLLNRHPDVASHQAIDTGSTLVSLRLRNVRVKAGQKKSTLF